jgi:hypothetical protein
MPFLLLLLSLSAIACDRADEIIIAGIAEALAEPPPVNARAVDCAKGADRYAAPGVLLTVDCTKTDGAAK